MIRWCLAVTEAAGLLVVARLLVAGLRFGLWRRWLGPLRDSPHGVAPDQRDNFLARAVECAARRVPGTYKCLPQAIALHWMLRRRHRPSELVIAVLPDAGRRGMDELHAWVEMNGVILIGQLDLPFRAVSRFGGALQD